MLQADLCHCLTVARAEKPVSGSTKQTTTVTPTRATPALSGASCGKKVMSTVWVAPSQSEANRLIPPFAVTSL
jgi:hypothetical protein